MPYFVFCIHNHQPVGNFEEVIEENYRRSYLPFLSALSRHPRVKLSLHTTGFLLDWMIKNHPEYVEMLRSMVDAGQVEIMGGGYYEPILSVIPERDRVRQITLFSDRIEKVFRTRPRGIWLAERVWEPTLPTTIRAAGLEYLVLDDYHFIKSGLTREELGGYYITEDQGNVIKIFPGSEALRYLIPFKPPGELEAHLRGLGGFLKRGNAAIYGDDGEKFGSWPGTHKWVFEDGWLESFLTMIEASLEWLTPLSLGEYLDMEEPVGQIYLPTTSYMEMGEWSLPAIASAEYGRLASDIKGWKDGERVRRFMQGGVWRNFFSKYPESNWMHKRMLMASNALERKRTAASQGDPDIDMAERLIHQAQCNDAYWHGVFGGLYLPHLRTKVYQSIIEAENILEAGAGDRCGVTVSDIDADDHSEAVMRTRDLNLFIKPSAGGSLVELDYKPKAVNFSNTLTRWHEGYHHKLEAREKGADPAVAVSIHDIVKVKEEGLERYLKYDTRRRASFVDRVLGADATIESFYANEFTETGDLFAGRYDCEIKDTRVILSKSAKAGGSAIDVRKVFKPDGHDSFKAEYQIKGAVEEGLRFAVEFNLMLPCCDGPATFYQSVPPMTSEEIGLGSSGVKEGVEAITISDTHTGVSLTIETERPATLWRFPVHTVSLSEGGFEKIYQGSCLVFIFDLDSRSAQMNLCFRVRAGSLDK